jgi:HK97 family phage prohead protease
VSIERRSVNLVDAEVKGRVFRGYAAVFDTPWSDALIEATGYVEKVARGMFRKALANSDNVPFLLEHDGHKLLATTASGNLRIKEDGSGLLTEAKLPDNYLGEYARSLVDTGDLKGMSYGVSLDPKLDTMLSKSGSGIVTRTIVSARKLLDVSLTWQPAYTATTAELRSTGFVAPTLQEIDSGMEEQTVDAATEEPPDDEAWWGEKPADAAPTALATPWWETYAKELERRF